MKSRANSHSKFFAIVFALSLAAAILTGLPALAAFARANVTNAFRAERANKAASTAAVKAAKTAPRRTSASDDTATLTSASRLTLGEVHHLNSNFVGDSASSSAMQGGQARPLAIASADFDGDGVPDLVSGFGAGNGGSVTVHRGNVNALWPYGVANRSNPPSPFFSRRPDVHGARVAGLPGDRRLRCRRSRGHRYRPTR